jgi:hypothetical protein
MFAPNDEAPGAAKAKTQANGAASPLRPRAILAAAEMSGDEKVAASSRAIAYAPGPSEHAGKGAAVDQDILPGDVAGLRAGEIGA